MRGKTDGYRPVKVPETIMVAVDRLVGDRAWGYRSAAEFVTDTLRRRLEELGYGPRPPRRPLAAHESERSRD